ncbi:MAG TPA: ATP-binding cassette domain-containing protein [Thermoanaerobaculia bacterium]|nr:ATP-binding cassette domain-containing protein [Thermoanaerobaculia bacterium]
MSVIVHDVVLPLAHFTLEVSVAMTARTTALYGPSGAGKTSLLEVIAGLRKPERGEVVIHGRNVTALPPRKRKVGYVPQDDALFPHLSVRQNITYGGTLDDAVIRVLEIAHLLDRGVTRLSGGERKRVALARALLSHPEVLLLDEPLSGVDSELRARVLEHLLRVRDEFRVPMIYVTHDLAEANAICEEIVLIERGRIMAP